MLGPVSDERDMLLEVNDLVKDYPIGGSGFGNRNLRAVDKVGFAVKPGETLAFVGESGSGKSTIGRCLLNLTETTAGEIKFRGNLIQNLPEKHFRAYRKELQIVFQSPIGSFNPRMKVGDALLEPMQLRDDLEKSQYLGEAKRLMEQVGLEELFLERYPNQMSGGQLQRVGVARALASQPELIFLDEPTSNLDLSIRGQIINLLLDQQEKLGLSYVLVTHDLRVVQFMADRVAVLYLGQCVEMASSKAIFTQTLHPYTRGLFAAIMIGDDDKFREKRRSFQLRGEVLRLEPNYEGCRLIRRCPFSVKSCEQRQELREIKPGHWSRCSRVEEIEHELSALGSVPL